MQQKNMCGRARMTLGADALMAAAGATSWPDKDQYRQTYNAAPTTKLPVVIASHAAGGAGKVATKQQEETPQELGGGAIKKEIRCMAWGLLQNPQKLSLFNARAEGVE